ncbi:M28 family peptidase [Brevundimonas denitrificans]|uniref:M28 family peptidase n=1 Tax=Brevundimonas denitrificans TaxID=1443434 RepID=UPI00223C1C34|nr:M28 family peptidase [Brevundimonas denitrificans]
MRGDGEGDHIYNGAWDNASGTVGLVEMARELKAAGPFERSIVFLHVTAEEQGLLGAFWYAAHPVYPLETTAANINIDMLPLSAPTRDLPIFGLGQNTLEDELQGLAEAEGRYVTDDGQPEQGFYFRSDHFAFARAGVPALMPWHGVDLGRGRTRGRAAGLSGQVPQRLPPAQRRVERGPGLHLGGGEPDPALPADHRSGRQRALARVEARVGVRPGAGPQRRGAGLGHGGAPDPHDRRRLAACAGRLSAGG